MIRIFKTKIYFNGFTLAEVLITLGIIGIVAAITIPILTNQIQDSQFKTAYKKAYSVACQAWQKAYSENLLLSRSNISDAANVQNFQAFKAEFDIAKDCGTSTYNCWSNDGNKWANLYPTDNDAQAFVDKSGMVWTQPYGWHGYIFVDVNGSQKPNKWGKDRFPFTTYVNGSESNAGIPDSVHVFTDSGPSSGGCPYPYVCYYQSWITGAQ